jgi:hypothetical protein
MARVAGEHPGDPGVELGELAPVADQLALPTDRRRCEPRVFERPWQGSNGVSLSVGKYMGQRMGQPELPAAQLSADRTGLDGCLIPKFAQGVRLVLTGVVTRRLIRYFAVRGVI